MVESYVLDKVIERIKGTINVTILRFLWTQIVNCLTILLLKIW